MYDDLLKNKIIVEFSNLLKESENKDKDNDIDSYTRFMKEVILNTYSEN